MYANEAPASPGRMSALSQGGAITAELNEIITRAAALPRGGVWWDFLRELDTSRLEDLLRAEPTLSEFATEQMRGSALGTSRLSVSSVISWTVQRAMAVGAEETVADLDRYASSTHYPSRCSIGLKGLSVDNVVDVGAGVELIATNDDISGMESHHDEEHRSSAVLTLVSRFPRLLAPNDDHGSRERASPETMQLLKNSRAAGEKIFERLDTARLCLALSMGYLVVETTRIAHEVESVPPAVGYGGSSASHIPVENRRIKQREIDSARVFHERLISLSASLRDRLRIALHRWMSSLQHGMTPDLFIDVGIGLECVYLPEKSSELKHRLINRAARLLGGTTRESRIEMAQLFDALYDARSHAVHKGRLLKKVPRGTRAENVEHLAMIGNHLLRESIIAMIQRGRDDWDELVFS